MKKNHRRDVLGVLRRIGIALVLIAILIVLSELTLKLLKVPAYLIPLPSQVFHTAFLTGHLGYFLSMTWTTMLEAIIGFTIGNAVAYLLALVFVRFPIVENLGLASAVAVKATPVVVLAPLFIIWFGNGIAGKCLMAGLICFFPMLVNALVGLRAVEPDILDYMSSLGASNTQILFAVRIPSSLPFAMAAAKTSSTISVVGAIIAELAGSDKGIGSIFVKSIWDLRTDQMFAAIFFAAVAGILFYTVVGLPLRYLATHGFEEMANVR